MKRHEDGKERKGHSEVDGYVEASWHFGNCCLSVCLSGAMGETAGGCTLGSFCMEDRLEDGTMTMTTRGLPSPLHVPRSFPPALDPALKGDKSKKICRHNTSVAAQHTIRFGFGFRFPIDRRDRPLGTASCQDLGISATCDSPAS